MNKKIAYGVLLLILLAGPFVMYPILLMKLLCFALFASAFNLLLGYTGLLSFGHAIFFGGAGYVTGFAMQELGLPFELGILAGVLAAAVVGWVMGMLAVRRQGIYFTMITLALAQMLYFVCVQAPFTHGEDGMTGVPRGKLLGMFDLSSDLLMYYVVLAITLGGFALIVRIIHSPYGQVLKAIKENEPRAISLGYDVDRYKLLAFVLSAALSGLAGATRTMVITSASLTDVDWAMSGLIVLTTLVGGLGTTAGPLVGAIVIVVLDNRLGEIGDWLANLTGVEWFHTLGDSVSIVTGLIFIACVLLFRKGIVGELLAWMEKRSGAKSAAA
ncbi:MAG TPA: branched-chain amino acid ABC transporter permease [Burkholderiaceae bacterium]|jgi:branched-chain amino acid transport system permease protein